MHYTQPPVIIDNGSQTTRAGYATDELPSLVFPSVYSIDSNGKVYVGNDEVDKHPENEIMTLLDDGMVYNWDNIIHNWQYAYDNIDAAPIDAKESGLLVTEPSWNTKKNKLSAAQIAFETLEVPVFSLVKTPLSQLFQQDRSTGLVIDIGAAITSVTPIINGTIQQKASFHSKYGGEFANFHALNFLKSKVKPEGSLNNLLPKPFVNSPNKGLFSESFINYQVTNKTIEDFKVSMLHVAEVPPNSRSVQVTNKSYYLPYGENINVGHEQYNLLEPLFQPSSFPLPDITLPTPTFEKPSTQGLTLLILTTLKTLEASFIPQAILENTANTSANSSHHARFNEILRELLSNILITGGGSLTTGLPQRVINDLYKSVNQFFPNYLCTQPGRLVLSTLGGNVSSGYEIWDKTYGAWLGAGNLASALQDSDSENSAAKGWFVTKSEYEEYGEDIVFEKFK